jgi:TolA-binding protein
MRRLLLATLAVALAAGPALAQKNLSEAELDQGPSKDLYIRKRPPAPAAPKLPPELAALMKKKIAAANAKRKQAIGLLRKFLATRPTGDSRAEGLFKLGQLLWEEARRVYIKKMDRYARQLEACRERQKSCTKQPKEPRLDFSESAELYSKILADHPNFRRRDLLLYLVGFAAKELGKNAQALKYFQAVIKQYPDSPLYGDSWMMIGEFYFAASRWKDARDAYANILKDKDNPTYDLALFKTAWCWWKLNDIKKAAALFKEVLDLAIAAQRSGSRKRARRGAQLRDEALDYLVIVFTEDQSISAKEIYQFLAGIGGEKYSRDVLVRVADAYTGQSEFERAVDTYKFLIGLKPTSLEAAGFQRKIVEAHVSGGNDDEALKEIGVLVKKFGPGTKWAKANRRYKVRLRRAMTLMERLVRVNVTNLHADAISAEKRDKRANLALYERAAKGYKLYLSRFGKSKNAAKVRFFRAEILFFKMKKYEAAGDEYLAVGRTAPVGKYHKEALTKAIEAFKRARPKNLAGRKELHPVDKKFGAAIDLYATLFPKDKNIVNILFEEGKLQYDYGHYDEAIKRFGVIVTKYPEHPTAGPAGDRILKALAKAEDYENIEEWARKLKPTKAFSSDADQKRLNRLIVESIFKSGDKYADGGRYARAANFYLRVPKEFPNHPRAPQAMFNAAVNLEKAKRPESAASVYLKVSRTYGRQDKRLAAKAAFTAGKVYESMAYFDRAAEAYEVVTKRHRGSKREADALFNAGLLRQALGQNRRAIGHYNTYARRFRSRKDAREVAFRIGIVYEGAGQDGRADRAYRTYIRRYKRGAHIIEAHTRSGRALLRLGHIRRASRQLKAALKLYDKLKKGKREAAQPWAAEARYHQAELVYRRFKRIKIDVKPGRLKRTLSRKTKLLTEAQKIYKSVGDIGDLHWATAALYRRGRVWELFGKALTDAPTPKGFTKAQAEAYRAGLDDYVVQVEDRAKAVYEGGYKQALQLQVYNKYTRLMREALGRIASSKYPPEREARDRVRIGDRPPKARLVKEVIRDK